jgi:glycosidase
MNYPIRESILELFQGSIGMAKFSERIKDQLNRYDRDNVYAMYNLLGSHDTSRIITELNGHQEKLKLAYAFLLAIPGAPAIYYGDEIGMEGGKDPDCRRAFPWEMDKWDNDLRRFIRQLISYRKAHPEMRRGTFQEIKLDNKKSGYSFARILGEDSSLMLMNLSDTPKNFRLQVPDLGWKDGRIIHDEFTGQEFIVSGTELKVSAGPWQGLWLN